MMKGVALLLLAVAAAPRMSPSSMQPVANADEACAVAKTRVIARDRLPESAIAFCDVIPAADSPRGYYIMALHSDRECEGICSTNMGWFAVRTSTGDVFDWNVAEWKPGRLVRRRP